MGVGDRVQESGGVMNPWVAFGIGVLVGTLLGILIAGLGRMAKDDSEFNERGEYECNYSSEDPRESGIELPLDGSLVESDGKMPVILNLGKVIDDQSIYLMPNDGFDYLTRKKMSDEAAKQFGVIRFVGDPSKAKEK